MNFKSFIRNFVSKAKDAIAYFESYSGLSGEEKKEKLDTLMTNWATSLLESSELSLVTKFIIKKFVIGCIPTITQAIFDLIKAKVSGITAE